MLVEIKELRAETTHRVRTHFIGARVRSARRGALCEAKNLPLIFYFVKKFRD